MVLGSPVPQECVLKAHTTCHCTQSGTLMKEAIWKISLQWHFHLWKMQPPSFISFFGIWTAFWSAFIKVLYKEATISYDKGGWNCPVNKLSCRMAEFICGCYLTSSSQWWVLPVFLLFLCMKYHWADCHLLIFSLQVFDFRCFKCFFL